MVALVLAALTGKYDGQFRQGQGAETAGGGTAAGVICGRSAGNVRGSTLLILRLNQ